MAVFSLTNATIWADGFDVSCSANSVEMGLTVQELDVTTFCTDGWTAKIGGLRDLNVRVAGFYEGDGIDEATFATLGTAGKPAMTVSADDAAGSVAYLFRPIDLSYDFLGTVGEAAPFSLETRNRDAVGLARGRTLAARQDVSATGALAGQQVGAVASGSGMYVATHVFAAGTTITYDIESDDNAGFTTPTTRATVGPITTTGSTWTAIAGPITDDYWRVNVTAVTGTFSLAVAAGVA